MRFIVLLVMLAIPILLIAGAIMALGYMIIKIAGG